MNIAVIGRGNVGTNLFQALQGAGHTTDLVCGHTLEGLPEEADAYVVCVKDDALSGVGERLMERVPEALVVHTAGSMSVDDLPHVRRGVFYPLQTFTKGRMVDFRSVPFFIEATQAEDLETLRMLATSLSDRCYEMSTPQRAYLHVAAVLCCNYANHLSALAAQLLERHGIPFDVMLPLLDETVRKLHSLHPLNAQTGPAVRHDHRVMDRQLALLAGEDLPQLTDIYRLLADSIEQLHT